MLVLSFGMLGIATLQVRVIKTANSAIVRGNFSQINTALGESLTANRFGARYLCDRENTQSERDLRLNDIDYWEYFFPNGNAGSARVGGSCGGGTANYMYNLWYQLDDSRATGGNSNTRIGLYYEF